MNCQSSSIAQIKDYIETLLKNGSFNVILQDVFLQLEGDHRKGARKLKQLISRAVKSHDKKIQRWRQMLLYETDLYEKGYRFIAGVDEAGRGPLAGPVVAAAVILDQNIFIPDINDSKKLSESQREFLYEEIQQKAVGVGVGIISSEIIDHINILRASLKAMKQAAQNLSVLPDFLLIDGPHLPGIALPMKALVRGDSLSLSVAAASIIAKVTRDRIMLELDRTYPQYGFNHNKGYPTPNHLLALSRFGPCKIHRKSFAPVKAEMRDLLK